LQGSSRLKARIAGSFYLLAVLTAAFAEGFVRGKLLYAAGLVPVACFVVATLLLYQLFRPVNRRLALAATLFNLVGLSFEALELHLWGVNVAPGFPVGVPASHSRHLDGRWRLGMADRSLDPVYGPPFAV
jgi:hypothetical protein